MSAVPATVAEFSGGGLPSPIGWEGFGHWANAGAAFCCALVAVWMMQRRARTSVAVQKRGVVPVPRRASALHDEHGDARAVRADGELLTRLEVLGVEIALELNAAVEGRLQLRRLKV